MLLIKKLLFFIPNLLTLFNLGAGFVGIIAISNEQLHIGAYCIWLGILFDFMDGYVARFLNSSSKLGKQLDSLADLVTFGALPGFILLKLMVQTPYAKHFFNELVWILPSFIFVACGALRLARFNIISTNQDGSFVGVPIPASALFISSYLFLLEDSTVHNYIYLLQHPYWLTFIALSLSMLMISRWKFIAFKFKKEDDKLLYIKYIFLITSALFLIFFKIPGITICFVLYLLFSMAFQVLL